MLPVVESDSGEDIWVFAFCYFLCLPVVWFVFFAKFVLPCSVLSLIYFFWLIDYGEVCAGDARFFDTCDYACFFLLLITVESGQVCLSAASWVLVALKYECFMFLRSTSIYLSTSS